jgi:basic amino acid/polyamine antiporter, APA family
MPRPFRVPFSAVFPLIGIAFCLYLMYDLPGETWIRFVVWLLAGLIIYFAYSRKHSRVRTGAPAPKETELPEEQR